MTLETFHITFIHAQNKTYFPPESEAKTFTTWTFLFNKRGTWWSPFAECTKSVYFIIVLRSAREAFSPSALALNGDSAHDWHHFVTSETPSDASFCTDCYTSWPRTTDKRTEKKISKHERNGAKVSGCASVINAWVSLRGRQRCWGSSLCPRLLYFPYANSVCRHTCEHKQKHHAAMTSLENRRSEWSCQRAHCAPVTCQNIIQNVWTCHSHCGIDHNSLHVDQLTYSKSLGVFHPLLSTCCPLTPPTLRTMCSNQACHTNAAGQCEKITSKFHPNETSFFSFPPPEGIYAIWM